MTIKERYKEYFTKFPKERGPRGCFHCLQEIVNHERLFILMVSHMRDDNELQAGSTIPIIFFHARCFKECAGEDYNIDFNHEEVLGLKPDIILSGKSVHAQSFKVKSKWDAMTAWRADDIDKKVNKMIDKFYNLDDVDYLK